jgi:hypothetical protein
MEYIKSMKFKKGDPKLDWLIEAVCRKVHATFPMFGMKKLCLRPDICPSNIIDIVADPKLWSTHKIKLVKMKVNECHWNCADLFQNYAEGDVQICVGFYASHKEKLGRLHTWLVHKDGYVIETVAKADIYVGTLLSIEDSKKFVRDSAKTRP